MQLRKFIPCLLLILVSPLLSAQVVVDFENFNLIKGQSLNGSDGKGGFTSGNIFLHNQYNADFNYWSGWAISAEDDTLTASFTNDLSCIEGKGAVGSTTYAVSYGSDNGFILKGLSKGSIIDKISLNNTTYTALSMEKGDAFAKKFGGVNGNDADFLSLTIHGWFEGQVSLDSVVFYLADYRNADNTKDYIVKKWQEISLRSLGKIDSLSFKMLSSDVGDFGINTPTYFCIDQVVIDQSNQTSETDEFTFSIFPNPAQTKLHVKQDNNSYNSIFIIKDMLGRTVQKDVLNEEVIDVSALTSGQYILVIQNNGRMMSKSFSKI